MDDFSRKVVRGSAFRRQHPGGTPSQLLHYVIHPLENDKPNSVVINVGTNRLGKDDPSTIANDIMDIVARCQSYAMVNSVHVCGLTFRHRFQMEIKRINNILSTQSETLGYKFIPNNNILPRHIWKDKIHLTDDGSKILGENILRSINSERT